MIEPVNPQGIRLALGFAQAMAVPGSSAAYGRASPHDLTAR